MTIRLHFLLLQYIGKAHRLLPTFWQTSKKGIKAIQMGSIIVAASSTSIALGLSPECTLRRSRHGSETAPSAFGRKRSSGEDVVCNLVTSEGESGIGEILAAAVALVHSQAGRQRQARPQVFTALHRLTWEEVEETEMESRKERNRGNGVRAEEEHT